MIARKYRNRRIGEFLKELKLTEGRNTGIPKIKRALKNNGSKEPEFETNEDRDYFITTIFMHEGFETITTQEKTYEKTYENVEEKILKFCIEAKSAKEIAEFCGYKGINRFKRNYLKPLMERGKIIMTIPDKPKSKNQKYIVNGIGDYTKEKYENPEEFTIEDFEKYMKNK